MTGICVFRHALTAHVIRRRLFMDITWTKWFCTYKLHLVLFDYATPKVYLVNNANDDMLIVIAKLGMISITLIIAYLYVLLTFSVVWTSHGEICYGEVAFLVNLADTPVTISNSYLIAGGFSCEHVYVNNLHHTTTMKTTHTHIFSHTIRLILSDDKLRMSHSLTSKFDGLDRLMILWSSR